MIYILKKIIDNFTSLTCVFFFLISIILHTRTVYYAMTCELHFDILVKKTCAISYKKKNYYTIILSMLLTCTHDSFIWNAFD